MHFWPRRISMKIATALAVAGSLACAREAVQAQNQTAGRTELRHYEFRADQLPPPFATQSAGNTPRVTSPPPGATLQLPPGFKATVYASGLDDPRHMLLAANGDVI